jgi:hypothetical protein
VEAGEVKSVRHSWSPEGALLEVAHREVAVEE